MKITTKYISDYEFQFASEFGAMVLFSRMVAARTCLIPITDCRAAMIY